MHVRHHRPSAARRLAHVVTGLALAATLGFSGPAGGAARAAGPPDCEPAGGSSARVMAGHEGVDPTSLTAAQAAELEARFERRVDRLRARGRFATRGGGPDGTIEIRTYIHVITRKDGTGAVSREQIRRQMGVINAGYAGRTSPDAASSPFRFVVADVDVTRNDAWYNWTLNEDGTEPYAMRRAKRALHRGGWGDLNIYIAGLGSGLLGYANYPGTVPLLLDGLVILNESMPGGAAAPYNRGDTSTHEIGHWLNLLHTFENGCEYPGDYVKDTPYQAAGENVFYCGDWPGDGTKGPDDTCPKPGKDPARNFMSYGDDLCLDQFTRGQVNRQVRAWFAFRA